MLKLSELSISNKALFITAGVLIVLVSFFLFAPRTPRGDRVKQTAPNIVPTRTPFYLKAKVEKNGTTYAITYTWEPQITNPTYRESLFIWNGKNCKSHEGKYKEGELLWSHAITTTNSHTYQNTTLKPGESICAQIWIDFYANEIGSVPITVTLP